MIRRRERLKSESLLDEYSGSRRIKIAKTKSRLRPVQSDATILEFKACCPVASSWSWMRRHLCDCSLCLEVVESSLSSLMLDRRPPSADSQPAQPKKAADEDQDEDEDENDDDDDDDEDEDENKDEDEDDIVLDDGIEDNDNEDDDDDEDDEVKENYLEDNEAEEGNIEEDEDKNNYTEDEVEDEAWYLARMALGDVCLRFVWWAWYKWHWAGSGDALGRRWVREAPRCFCVAGVALGDACFRFIWQAWHLAISGDTHLHFVWQAWHKRHWAGSGDGLGHRWVRVGPRCFCLAGVALGDIYLRFAWQAWHLARSIFSLCGRRGTNATGLGLVTALVAAGSVWRRAFFA
eukprot:s541_g12.t1